MSAPLMSYVLTGVLALDALLSRVFWESFSLSSHSDALAQLVTVLEMAVTLLGLGLVVVGAFSGRRSTPGLQGGVPNPYGR